MSDILTVQQLTQKIKYAVETVIPYIWVKGEVTNCTRPTSGHVYFSLKDADAYLHCVWFKGNQREQETFDPLTGEVFEDGPRLCLSQSIANGQQIICAGKINIYPPKGEYQLLVDIAQPEGLGEWYLRFEKLKKEFQQKGYFELQRKKIVPRNPKKIALITSPIGAAIQDFIRISKGRGIKTQMHLYPVTVQGEDAVSTIIQAIKEVNKTQWAEVVVLIRGGGSYQDLMAFSDKQVVEAIYTSKLPVVTGIGHESDVSLADLTADLRAATPSHAAQLLLTEHSQIIQQIDEVEIRLAERINIRLQQKQEYIHILYRALHWLSPFKRLERVELQVTSLQERLYISLQHILKFKETQYTKYIHLLSQNTIHKTITHYNTLLCLLQHKMNITVSMILSIYKQRITDITYLLSHYFSRYYQKKLYQYEKVHISITTRNPSIPLERGYALVYLYNGQLLRHINEAPEHTKLTIQISNGFLPVTVTKKSFRTKE